MLPIRNFGYSKTPTARLPRQNALEITSEITSNQKFISTVLWPCLFKAYPNWMHGLQGTGDCVSWMASHMADISDSIRNLFNPRICELRSTCSESIYGFGKCELFDNYRWHGAGMMGIDAILALEKFGRLLRKKYPNYDLSEYSGERAEAWAEKPSRSHGVPDVLEPEAENHRIMRHLEVTDTMTAAAFIEAGYPVGYCGDTRWGRTTDEFLIATQITSGAHAMALTGVRYDGRNVSHFWCANTGHGDHVSNPRSGYVTPSAYRACGCWIPKSLVQPVLAAGDCYVISLDGLWNIHTLLPECTKLISLY